MKRATEIPDVRKRNRNRNIGVISEKSRKIYSVIFMKLFRKLKKKKKNKKVIKIKKVA